MKTNVKFICIKFPPNGNFNLNSIYEAQHGWFNADAGETELRIWDENNKCYRFRDYSWLEYFKEF